MKQTKLVFTDDDDNDDDDDDDSEKNIYTEIMDLLWWALCYILNSDCCRDLKKI